MFKFGGVALSNSPIFVLCFTYEGSMWKRQKKIREKLNKSGIFLLKILKNSQKQVELFSKM